MVLPGTTLRAKIDATLDDLAPFYEALLADKRVLFLLDGLNELPSQNRAENLSAVRELMKTCEQQRMRAIVTCREHDYTGDFDLKIPLRDFPMHLGIGG